MDTDRYYTKIRALDLELWASELLEFCGFDLNSSKTTAGGLVLASERGIDSHGIRLLPHYLESGTQGRLNFSPRLNFSQTGDATGILDADHGLGFPAGVCAMQHATRLSVKTGVGVVTVNNSSHGGMMAYYTLPVAEEGNIAIATTNTTPRLIPTGGTAPFFGTNPFCYAVPLKNEAPLCYDAATTQITGNKIKLHRQNGQPLPKGVAADAEGNPTTDPFAAELLHPFGGYKGMGIAMFVDILCGALTGMPDSESVSKMYGNDLSELRMLGQTFMVFDIHRFRSLEFFCDQLQEEVDRMRKLRSIDGERVMAPGDPEKQCQVERSTHGIPFTQSDFESLNQAAVSRGFRGLESIISSND